MLSSFRHILKLIIVFVSLRAVLQGAYCFADEDIRLMISKAEARHAIPIGLLHAIARVESKYNPYAINVAGGSIVVKSVEEAIKLVKSYLNQGHTNIDIGIMQINYYYHKKNFANVRTMIIPEENIKYAARLLSELYKQHGSWNKAVRHYHSATIKHHRKYADKVLVTWLGS